MLTTTKNLIFWLILLTFIKNVLLFSQYSGLYFITTIKTMHFKLSCQDNFSVFCYMSCFNTLLYENLSIILIPNTLSLYIFNNDVHKNLSLCFQSLRITVLFVICNSNNTGIDIILHFTGPVC